MLLLGAVLLAQLQVPSDAYADSATRTLVHELRAARRRNEQLVTSYQVRVSSRMGVGMRAMSRDRMLWRQELVADISWRRDSISTARIVGAREAVPVASGRDQLPSELRSSVHDLIVDPGSDYLHVIGIDDDGIVYPLRDGGEQDYRFAIGGVTEIGLPDGHRIRIVALEVTPRRTDWRLMSGTLWFDEATKGLVRAAFRPARPFELQRDLDAEDGEDVPGWVNVRAEARFITLEYALYGNRWWMPRYVAIDAVGTMGAWLNVPFRLERIYQDYEVEGGAPPDPMSQFVPAGRSRWIAADGTPVDTITRRQIRADLRACIAQAKADTSIAATDTLTRRARIDACREQHLPDNLTVVVPTDTAALLTAPELGSPILTMGDLITSAELASLRGAIEEIPDRPWQRHLQLPDGLGALFSQARYNRIEALSLGAKLSADLGRFGIEGLARLGLADLEPNATLAVVRQGVGPRWSVEGYHRLETANPDAHPFGPVNSAMAFFAGRDDGQYFRNTGAAVALRGRDDRWAIRAWHQRERAVVVETDVSLPQLLDGDRHFRPNIAADAATQTGASLALRASRPLSRATTIGMQLMLDGATGTFDFGRGSAVVRATVAPITSPIGAALTLAAGSSRGEVPVQSRFFLGGAGSLRGYAGGFVSGDAYWLVRGEVSRGAAAARLIGFADIGWAGSRDQFGKGDNYAGVGLGLSLLDGLIRFDLAHGLNAVGGTRLELYFDGML